MTIGLSTALAKKATELLDDGEWHNYERVIRTLIRVVPPGPAMRRNEKDRTNTHTEKRKANGWEAPPERKYEKPAEERIYSGARSIVRDFLNNRAVFEKDRKGSSSKPNDPEIQIRMVGQHRGMGRAADPFRVRADMLALQVEELQETIANMRAYLVQIGHARAAQRLAPTGGGE